MGWLERVPTYKEQQNNLREKDLSTYGFLGYPLMQAADILVYKADYVPVGEDQVVHVEFSREVARRFNYLYGRDANYLEKAEQALERMGKKNAKLYRRLQKAYQEQGCHESLERGQALVEAQGHLKLEERERLTGYLEGVGKILLPEPEALLTKNPKLPGLDGQKMSKSYHNTISLRDKPDVVDEKVRTMQTDPARIRLSDPGNPEKCPVWNLHQVYSSEDTKQWVQEGCRYAKIGCLDCKRPIIEAIQKELAPIQERAEPYIENPTLVKSILNEGSEAAREEAKETLIEVREVIGVDYR
jgi:tryptophanyl-tRNA synthetase